MNWRIRKLLRVTGVFVAVWLVFCALVALVQFMPNLGQINFPKFINQWGNNALFFLGYGDLREASWSQNAIALIAILAISILTTYFTINFLWRVDDVVLVPALFVEKEGEGSSSPYKVKFVIVNQGKRIADLRLSFTAYKHTAEGQERISKSREYTYPILFKNSSWTIPDELKMGFFQDVLYRQFANMNTTSETNAEINRGEQVTIYMTLWFVDTQSGQECCNIMNFQAEDLLVGECPDDLIKLSYHKMRYRLRDLRNTPEHKKDLQEFVAFAGTRLKSFDTDRLTYSPRNCDSFLRLKKLSKKNAVASIEINTQCSTEEYPMFFFDYKNAPLDWTIYDDDHVHLIGDFKIKGDEIQRLRLEVKSGDGYDRVYTFYSKTVEVDSEGRVRFDICLKEMYQDSHNPNYSEIREINIIFPREKIDDVLVDFSGKVKVLKFGLEYMAPEMRCTFVDEP